MTNTIETEAIVIKFNFSESGSGPDHHVLRVLGPDNTTSELANIRTDESQPAYIAEYKIANPALGSTYQIEIIRGSSDGSSRYCLTVAAFPTTTTDPTLVISPTSQAAAVIAGDYSVDVVSNTNWTYAKSASWITTSEPTSQSGNQSFSYSVVENTTLSAREGTITFTGGGITRIHTVMQDPRVRRPDDQAAAPGSSASTSAAAGASKFWIPQSRKWQPCVRLLQEDQSQKYRQVLGEDVFW